MREELKQYIDVVYKTFQEKSIFTKYEILGVRTKYLQKIAKTLHKQLKFDEFFNDFLKNEKFFEYLQIVAYGINYEKDYQKALKYANKYLRFVDNWANCDTLYPKSFTGKDILKWAKTQIDTKHAYRIRFGILCLMRLVEPENGLDIVFNIKSEKYYVNMARAWYFQAMLAKDLDKTLKFLQNNSLDKTTLRMTFQKCQDSLQIGKEKTKEIKAILNKK